MAGLPPPPGGNPPGGYPSDRPSSPGGFPPPPGGGAPPPPGGYPPASPPPAQGPYGAGPYAAPGPYGTPGAPAYDYGPGTGPVMAGFWLRFAALFIDSIVVGLFGLPAQIALRTGATQVERCPGDSSGDVDPFGTASNGLCEVPTSGTWVIFGILVLIAAVAGIVYYAKLEGGSGQTLGKRAVGIRVVDSATGGSIGTGRGVGRYFARILSAIVCYLGYFWMLWDPQKQCWHDKMVNSYVIKT